MIANNNNNMVTLMLIHSNKMFTITYHLFIINID